MTTKTALVTGATRGIGKATALALARRGYDVAITGRTRQEGDAAKFPESEEVPELKKISGSLETTVAEIEAIGRRAYPFVLDLLDRATLVPVVEQAIDALGHVDVLVNNAVVVGRGGLRRFYDSPQDEIEEMLSGDLTAQLVITQPVFRHMVDRGSGTIAFMSSGSLKRPLVGPGAMPGPAITYPVSKAGLDTFAELLPFEHAHGDAIRIYSLGPGAVITERILADPEKFSFNIRFGAPVDVVGEATARILDDPPAGLQSGGRLNIQDQAREWGML